MKRKRFGPDRTGTGSGCPPSRGMTTQRAYGAPSMRPGIATVGGEIVGVRQAAAHGRLGLEDLIGNAETLAVGDRFLRSVEAQLHLLTHITRTRPAHQRLDLARLFRLLVEHPFLGLGGARLHRSLRGLVDTRRHDRSLARSRTNMVGAAGFEPATWSTQNSRATRLRYAPVSSRRASIHGSLCPSKPRPDACKLHRGCERGCMSAAKITVR